MSMATIAIGTAAVGAGEAAVGLIKGAKAKKAGAELDKNRPKYNISPYASRDVSMAESSLSGGMGGEATQAYTEGIDKSFSSTLNAILKSGGSGNTISSVFGNTQDGYRNLALMKEQMRMQKMDELVKSHQYYNNELDKEFGINKLDPWKDNKQAVAVEKQNASNLVTSGINTAVSAGMNYLGEKQGVEDAYKKYFGDKPPVPQQQTQTARFGSGNDEITSVPMNVSSGGYQGTLSGTPQAQQQYRFAQVEQANPPQYFNP